MYSKLIFSVLLLTVAIKLSRQIPIAETQAYTECAAKTARCYDLPHQCLASKNCKALTYVKPNTNSADFQIWWQFNTTATDRWIGAALSNDLAMGNDSVVECILFPNNTAIARYGLTHAGATEEEYGVTTVATVSGITNARASYANGILTCSWTRAASTSVSGVTFNIVSTKYYVFMAFGPLNGVELASHGNNYWNSLTADSLANTTIS